MRNRLWLAVAVASILAAGPAGAQEDPAAEQAMMAEIMSKYGSPGPEHTMMEPLVGKWTFESMGWMEPDAEPMTSSGTAEYGWIHGGRYLMQTASGDMMGMPFEGGGILGYDRFREELFATWGDNMSTGFMYATGTIDDSGKVFTTEATLGDPWAGERDRWMKSILTIADDDNHRLEMYVKAPDGSEFKTYQINYTRADVASK